MSRKRLMTIAAFAVVAASMSLPSTSPAATLSWDVHPDTTVAGYSIWRAPMSCATAVGTGPKDTGSFVWMFNAVGRTVTSTVDPVPVGTYCWVLTAYTAENLESLFSNKVGLTVSINPPQAPLNLTVRP